MRFPNEWIFVCLFGHVFRDSKNRHRSMLNTQLHYLTISPLADIHLGSVQRLWKSPTFTQFLSSHINGTSNNDLLYLQIRDAIQPAVTGPQHLNIRN
ncbi:hypothetical protein BDN70DRAFT_361158 [Pholiota conissans]|uniref:Uncharacterized protein n=1 Tax=Pholiota conissans TaxID=109636 RepID=A0A9P5YRG0_9AGAR|nr:hypothetical protein BDN70DRAFT_361158 [Pholiota conissans]